MRIRELDLTTGDVTKKLAQFALPLLLANLLQSLYSVADMLVVGRLVGETGLAAISNASMLCFIINALCIGFTTGGTVLVAQCRGAGNARGEAEALTALAAVTLAASAGVTALGLAAYRPLFKVMGVPPEAMADACGYMRIICWGTVFVFGYNAVCSVMKGRGDGTGPLLFVFIAAVINVGLDLLLVGPLGLGTEGAALATVAAQGCSLLLALVRMEKRGRGQALSGDRVPVRRETLCALLRTGGPTAAQMVLVNLSFLLATGMLNQFGVSVAAASGIGLKVNTLAGMPCWAVGQAVTAMAGQNLGAGDLDRVRRTAGSGLWLSLGVTAATAAVIQVSAAPIIGLFDPASPQVLEIGVTYLRLCCGVNALVYAAMYALDSFAIGVGGARVAMVNALLDAAVVRLPLSWLLAFPLDLGYPGIYLAQALSPLLPAAVGLLYLRRGAWRTGIQRQ